MARFYRLSTTPSLFGDTCVMREWGRIGGFGRIRIDLYEKLEDAIAAHAAIAHAKRRRGYEEVIADEQPCMQCQSEGSPQRSI